MLRSRRAETGDAIRLPPLAVPPYVLHLSRLLSSTPLRRSLPTHTLLAYGSGCRRRNSYPLPMGLHTAASRRRSLFQLHRRLSPP